MPTNRNHLRCNVCGTKTITRVSLIYGPYREFAFPCPACGVEIRVGVEVVVPTREDIERWVKDTKLPEETFVPEPKYTKLLNATWLDYKSKSEWSEGDDQIENVEILDDTFLVAVPKPKHFSPFILAFELMEKHIDEYQSSNHIRRKAAANLWPALDQLRLHSERRQWPLFDKQFKDIFETQPPNGIAHKKRVMHEALEHYGLVFCKDQSEHEVVYEHILKAENSSSREVRSLVDYYKSQNKDAALEAQLTDVRRRWARLFSSIAALYTTHYWDASRHRLDRFTLAQKRFDDLKVLYVDSFETFCRISVIAATVEGINSLGRAAVPKSKGEFTISEFDVLRNGNKADVLSRLGSPIADLFVPFMDHRLRNGIGHNSAYYDVVRDEVHYLVENEKGRTEYKLPYILFCEKLFNLYLQLEVVSRYVTWILLFYMAQPTAAHSPLSFLAFFEKTVTDQHTSGG